MNDEIEFEVRTRKRVRHDFWSIEYNPDDGNILKIEPGKTFSAGKITVTFARIQKLLDGSANQNDFKIDFNEDLGALDLVDVKKIRHNKKFIKNSWFSWLGCPDWGDNNYQADIRFVLFEDTGMLRIEAGRRWITQYCESASQNPTIDLFITDINDPHILFSKLTVPIVSLVQQGYWEKRLWSFMSHDIVQHVLYHGQGLRINLAPVAKTACLFRFKEYFSFSGIVDDQVQLSHNGPGKHLTVYVKDNALWAQSHYQSGCAIDALVGNLKAAVILNNEPDHFIQWVELPALMMRQEHPFELVQEWTITDRPNLLYKASNLDIGVLT